jgi:hypothetical protein
MSKVYEPGTGIKMFITQSIYTESISVRNPNGGRCIFCGEPTDISMSSNVVTCNCEGAEEYHKLWNDMKDKESQASYARLAFENHLKNQHPSIELRRLRNTMIELGQKTGAIQSSEEVDRVLKILKMERVLGKNNNDTIEHDVLDFGSCSI